MLYNTDIKTNKVDVSKSYLKLWQCVSTQQGNYMALDKTNQEQEIDAIDMKIAENELKLEKHNALKVLFDENTDAGKAFKVIILDGYAKEEADRLTSAITTPDGQKREHLETAFDKLKGIRHLRGYLTSVELEAMYAAETLDELKFTKNDIKANPGKYLDSIEG